MKPAILVTPWCQLCLGAQRGEPEPAHSPGGQTPIFPLIPTAGATGSTAIKRTTIVTTPQLLMCKPSPRGRPPLAMDHPGPHRRLPTRAVGVGLLAETLVILSAGGHLVTVELTAAAFLPIRPSETDDE